MNEIKCPHCNVSFPVSATAIIPQEQTLFLEMKCESEMFGAETIGKAILSMEEIQRGVAESMGIKVCVFLKSIELKPHEISIGFQIIQQAAPPKGKEA